MIGQIKFSKMSNKKCVICDKNLKNSKISIVCNTGLKKLIEISIQKGDSLHEVFGSQDRVELHLKCRNKYVSFPHSEVTNPLK